MSRPDKTLIDYLIIAISPALIMTLVGSLVFFLLDVFYVGNYAGRLEYIFALFVFAAVLVARISIEESRERAMLFAVPLAIATLLAITRFVQFDGALAAFSIFINCGLIAIVWWSANKLTWDCTMIDEDAEDSGEGLMEAVGLEKPGKAAIQAEIAPINPQEGEAPAEPRDTPESSSQSASRREPRPPVLDHPFFNWLRKLSDRRKRPHAPGVWIVYFSLAALPLFGIGQFFIPSTNQENRQYAFQLLFVYTASGLALLLATSFLGLRRYLRQRRQEMPVPIVNLWLGIGASLIVAAMILALLLPRSNAEYDLSDLAPRVGSPDQQSSQFGVGSDGVEEKQPDAKTKPSDSKDADATTDQKSDKTDSSQSSDKGKDGKPQEGQSESKDNSQSNDQSKSDDSKKEKKDKSNKNTSNKSNSKETESKNEQPDKKKDSANSSSDSSDKKDSANEKKEQKPSSGGQTSPPKIQPPSMPHLPTMSGFAWLLLLFKWIFYLILAILAIYAILRYREAIWKGFCDFVQFLIDLWHNLFGGKKQLAEEEAEVAAKKKRQRRFADFRDPFAAGVADRYPPAELVRYTFNALEAWARDRGAGREPDQTPHEFVRSVAIVSASLGPDAAQLAELYSQVAYAPFTLPPGSAAQLSQLWQIMRAEALPPATAVTAER